MKSRTEERIALAVLLVPVLLIGILTTVGPFATDPVAIWGGIGYGGRPGFLPGDGTIDPNIGDTSFALGIRAARELLSGTLPLWNHFEGLGAPLLGEMQSAALFPPTLLLLLPHGQAIEQALLQAAAGLGTYLFLRRFGLGATASLAGGLLYEFNGVFAWLRNAAFNPVAFLPWLLFIVESLFRLNDAEAPIRERGRLVCLGALLAALAVYAGFPEVVYFDSLLLTGWVALRLLALRRGRAAFLGDLLATAALALLMSAPLLLAFAGYLAEATTGGHAGTAFRDVFLPPQAFIVTLMPYVFGPIFAAPQLAVRHVWGNIGGYLGLMPVLLAAGGIVCRARHRTTWLLAVWIVVTVGASHGVPLLHGMLAAVPFVTMAAYYRYLDASWLFACVVLAASFIDATDALSPAIRRRVALAAIGAALLLLAAGVGFAWPVLQSVWKPMQGQRRTVALSFVAVVALAALFLLALRRQRPARPLAALAFAEAFALFLLPFASYPRDQQADWPVVDFLQRRAGMQRFAIASGTGLAPNFGSSLGVAAINYDDLPVPARTVAYVTERLDPTSNGLSFEPKFDRAETRQIEDERARFIANLAGYAAAGVKYVLASNDPFAEPAYPLSDGPLVAVQLATGQSAVIDADAIAAPHTIGTVAVMIGTHGGKSDGELRAQLCQAARCVAGSASLATATDNRRLALALAAPFALTTGAPYRITLSKEGGNQDVALWLQRGIGARVSGLAVPSGHLPIVDLTDAVRPAPVLRTATTSIYEIADPRPYASAPGCAVDAVSYDRMRARCAGPSRLLRLELFMRGWSATVNGVDATVLPVEDTFQAIDLPAGESAVEFSYAPRGVRTTLPVALAVCLLCLGALARSAFAR